MKTQKKTRGFSLVEVIVATAILSVTVFGVYKLISENTKVVENSNLILQENNLFDITKNCIENQTITEKELFLNLGANLDTCIFQTTETVNSIDNIDYTAKITTSQDPTHDDIIIWELSIFTEFRGTKTQKYVQRK